MFDKLNNKHIVLIVFQIALALSLSMLSARSSVGGERIGVVRDLKGAVSRTSENKNEALAIGAEVFLNDVISTEPRGYVILTLSNASELTIGPETQLTVDRFVVEQGHDLEAVSGAMGFEAEGEDPSGNETIRTVFGMIGVRG